VGRVQANGVPCVVLPPARGPRADAPVVVAWHLLDAPGNERDFAAAVPLAGLDAWKVYLGLPLSGSRLPAGGEAEIQRRVQEDAVLRLHRHVVEGALAEFPGAFADVRREFGIADGVPVGVMGGSMGAAAAQLVIAEGGVAVRAAVLINPVTRMRDTIEALSRRFGATYGWTPASTAFAERTDFAARAEEIGGLGAGGTAIRYITGADDLPDAILEPVAATTDALRVLGVVVDHRVVPDMAHSFYDEQAGRPTPQAAVVDGLAAEWFGRYL
jgi:pimeloyl-ACP methyl ester carboxylesterase